MWRSTRIAALVALAVVCGAAAGGCKKAPVVKVDIPMALVPAGSFQMGSPPAEPGRHADELLHDVTLRHAFYVSATPVTQGQYRLVMGTNPSYFKNCGDDCPVEEVNWYDALQFCNKLSTLQGLEPCYNVIGIDVGWNRECAGYRLPTEAEWEYAARAGAKTALPNGDLRELNCGLDPNLDKIAWYCGNSAVNYAGCLDASGAGAAAKCAGTHPVAQKLPNAWRLYDMEGDVLEWVWDAAGDYPTEAAIDPDNGGGGSEYRRINRGCGWHNYASYCRPALRNRDLPGVRGNGLGFRIARTAPAAAAPPPAVTPPSTVMQPSAVAPPAAARP
jgi:formylglycine-generating enzyme required for sulfatase activity